MRAPTTPVRRAAPTAAALLLALLPALLVGAPAAGAAPSAAAQQPGGCWLYVARIIELSVASPLPGQRVVVSGTAGPSETVQITIGQVGRAPVVDTTATTNPAARYTRPVTIPTSARPGIHRVTVTSPACGVAMATLVVRYPDNRCRDHREATVVRPMSSSWQLLGVFDWSRPVAVRLVPEAGGTTREIRPAQPASPGLTFTWASATAWAPGWYTVSEVGTSPFARVQRVADCGRVLVS